MSNTPRTQWRDVARPHGENNSPFSDERVSSHGGWVVTFWHLLSFCCSDFSDDIHWCSFLLALVAKEQCRKMCNKKCAQLKKFTWKLHWPPDMFPTFNLMDSREKWKSRKEYIQMVTQTQVHVMLMTVASEEEANIWRRWNWFLQEYIGGGKSIGQPGGSVPSPMLSFHSLTIFWLSVSKCV